MTVQQLYDKLASKEFQDPANSDLSYNYFIFQYQVEKEAEIRRDIAEFKANLIRPVNFVDVLTLDIFDVFCKFLDQRSFGKHASSLAYLLEKDTNAVKPTDHEAVTRSLSNHAQGDDFLSYVQGLILAHIEQSGDDKIRPYVFLYGFGAIYPYLRANEFLAKYEKFNKASRYKIILFYPGVFRENRFSLFEKLNEEHGYRAHVLMN